MDRRHITVNTNIKTVESFTTCQEVAGHVIVGKRSGRLGDQRNLCKHLNSCEKFHIYNFKIAWCHREAHVKQDYLNLPEYMLHLTCTFIDTVYVLYNHKH